MSTFPHCCSDYCLCCACPKQGNEMMLSIRIYLDTFNWSKYIFLQFCFSITALVYTGNHIKRTLTLQHRPEMVQHFAAKGLVRHQSTLGWLLEKVPEVGYLSEDHIWKLEHYTSSVFTPHLGFLLTSSLFNQPIVQSISIPKSFAGLTSHTLPQGLVNGLSNQSQM